MNICYFADNTTHFVCNKTLKIALDNLEGNSELSNFWFGNKFMKPNADQCHLLIARPKYEHSWANIVDD